jgi:hypothetical protein
MAIVPDFRCVETFSCSIDTGVIAIGLLSNLETAQHERSVLLLDEQNLLVKEEKEGCA